MINDVVLVGRLTKDPQVQYTQAGNGVAYVNFILAVNRTFTNSKGKREADFISCQLWRKGAENLGKYATKGSLIGIQGRIQTSSYDNQQGQRVYRTDIVSDRFSLLESKQEAEARRHNANQNQQENNSNSNYRGQNTNSNSDYGNKNTNSIGNGNQGNDPFFDKSQPIDISDDDLPF